jgi:uncharacterized membrane protein YkvA (DUF1232 family)
MSTKPTWKERARALRRETRVMYLAILDRRTPWYAKALGGCVVAYALSPIDLIPDPIPVVGYLDDLLIVPLGVMLTRRLIPEVVLVECRSKVDEATGRRSQLAMVGLAFMLVLWLATAAAMVWGAARWFGRH